MNNLTIKYKASVHTPAGWRSVYMTAEAITLSEKRVEITRVTHIDDEEVQGKMSRTGSKRQSFSGGYFADQEIGKKKNISSLYRIIEKEAA